MKPPVAWAAGASLHGGNTGTWKRTHPLELSHWTGKRAWVFIHRFQRIIGSTHLPRNVNFLPISSLLFKILERTVFCDFEKIALMHKDAYTG